MGRALSIWFQTSERHEQSTFYRFLNIFLVICMALFIFGIGGAFAFVTIKNNNSILMSALLGFWAFAQISVFALGIYGILKRKRIGFFVMPGIFLFSAQQILTAQNESFRQAPGFIALGVTGLLTAISLISYFHLFPMKKSQV